MIVHSSAKNVSPSPSHTRTARPTPAAMATTASKRSGRRRVAGLGSLITGGLYRRRFSIGRDPMVRASSLTVSRRCDPREKQERDRDHRERADDRDDAAE